MLVQEHGVDFEPTNVSEEGKERDLTDSEMHELLSTYQLNLRWD